MDFDEAVAVWIRSQLDPEWANWNEPTCNAARALIVKKSRQEADLRELENARNMVVLTGRLDWPPESVPERLRRTLDEVWNQDELIEKLEILARALPHPASDGAWNAVEIVRRHTPASQMDPD